MNKQEVIEKIKGEKILGGINSYGLGYNEALDEAIYIVKQLDEPEKPVLSKDEAEWIDRLTEVYSLPNALYFITRYGWGDLFSFEVSGKVYSLLVDSHMTYGGTEKLKERLVNAVLYGYEVEKEKLYTVELPNPHDNCHTILYKNPNGNISIEYDYDDDWYTGNCYQLTEEEIKEDFEWAFQFAKEVKE